MISSELLSLGTQPKGPLLQEVNKNVKRHLFICCRQKTDKACCHDKQAPTLVKNLKIWLKEEGLYESIKVSQSSCLGHCQEGITACLYPENRWFTQLSLDQEDTIKRILRSPDTPE